MRKARSIAESRSSFEEPAYSEQWVRAWRGAGGPIHIRRPKHPHPTAPAFIDAPQRMGIPFWMT